MIDKWADALCDGGSRVLEFIEWLGSKGYSICETDSFGEYFRTHKSDIQLVSMFYDIDPDQLERERRALLDEQIAKHEEYIKRREGD
jgi:hypothetical protein